MKHLLRSSRLNAVKFHCIFAAFLFISASVSAASPPVISSISPTSGTDGTTVTINGSNFSTTAANNFVFFGNVRATVTSATASVLKVTVPDGAYCGQISVEVGLLTGYSSQYFTPTFSCGSSLDTSGWEKGASYTTGGSSPEGSASGDLDGDGLIDVVIPNNSSNTISIFHNAGKSGSFTSASLSSPIVTKCVGNPFMVTLGDLNGDGRLDVVVGGFSTDSFWVFPNTSTSGSISFGTPLKFQATGNVCRMVVTDMDADGKADLVLVNRSKFISIYKSNVTSTTMSVSDFTKTDITVSSTAQMNDIVAGDLNGDGVPDLVTTDLNSANMYVFINNGSLSFTKNTVAIATNNVWGLSLADMDGDGKPDITGAYRFSTKFFIFLNTSSGGTFSVASEQNVSYPSGSTVLCITTADLNGDGKIDLIGADLASKNGVIIVQNNSTSGSLSFGTAFGLGNKSQALVPVIADIDGDGKPDIVIQDNSSKLIAFRNKNFMSASITPAGSATKCSGDSFKMTANTISGVTYQWYYNGSAISGATSQVYYGKNSGSYMVGLTSGGCTVTSFPDTLTISTINKTVSVIGTTTRCQGDSVQMVAAGGTGLSYQWRKSGVNISGATKINYAATTSGTYKVVITNGNSCSDSSSGVTVVINPLPASNAGSNTSVCAGNSASIGAASTAGITYSWSSSPSGFTSTASNPSVSPSATTIYTVSTTTTATGCLSSASVTVTVNAKPAANAGSASTICSGSTATIGAASVSGSTYSWSSTPSGFSSSSSSATVTPSSSTTYTVTETVTATGCSNSNSVTITVNSLPSANAGSNSSVCAGSSAAIGVSAVSGSTYTWTSAPSGFSSTAATVSVTPSTTTTYTLTETNAAGCSKTNSVTVTVNALPSANAGSSVSICSGSPATIGGASVSGNTYSWSSNPSGFSSSSSSATVNPSTTTTYTLTEKVTATGCTNSNSVTITVNSLPSANAGSNSSVCAGSSATIGSTAVSGSTYAWTSSPSGFSSTAATASVTPSTTTTYTLTETNASGCSRSNSVVITVNPLPVANAGSAVSICSGSSVMIGAAPISGNTYSWSAPSATLSSSSAANPTASPVTTTTYTLTEKITSTGCTKTNSVTVTVLSLPTASAGSASTICAGQGASIGAASVSGSSYSWTSSPSGFSSTSSSNVVFPASTITYTVTEKNAAGCSMSNSVTVTVNPRPVAVATATGSTTRCLGDSVLLNANTSSNVSYQWKVGGLAIKGATGSSYIAKTAGDYYVVVSNTSTGCIDSSSKITVTILALPSAKIITSATSVCYGNSVNLNITTTGAGSSYQWYLNGKPLNGAVKASYFGFDQGTYTATVTNSNGCSALSNAIGITVNPLPVVALNSFGSLTRCDGDSVVLEGSNIPGATYQWSADGAGNIKGATSYRYAAKTTGTYRLTVTSAQGCVSDTIGKFIPVIFNTLPTALISPLKSTLCNGQSITLRTNTVQGATYVWMLDNTPLSGATGNTFSADKAGMYSAMITNSAGCSATTPGSVVIVNPLPVASIKALDKTTICPGGSVLFSASETIELSTYQWGIDGIPVQGAVSDTFTGYSGGEYRLTVRSKEGCSAVSNKIKVIVSTPPVVSIQSPATSSICDGQTIILHGSVSGSAGMQWWADGNKISGATSDSITVGKTGNYTLVASNSDKCEASASTVITVNPLPVAGFSMSANKICAGSSLSLYNQSYISKGTLNYTWISGNGDTLQTQNGKFVYDTAGIYHITLSTVSGSGCSAMATDSVVVQKTPFSTFTSEHIGFRRMVFKSSDPDTAGNKYDWNFGDNTTGGGASFMHTYSEDGTYKAMLTVSNTNGCSSSATNPVTVNTTGVDPGKNQEVTVNVFPNPYQDQTTLVYILQHSAITAIAVFDVEGKRVSFADKTMQTAGEHHFVFKGDKPGIYFIKLYVDGQLYVNKIIRQN
jgi:PKD repeat protein